MQTIKLIFSLVFILSFFSCNNDSIVQSGYNPEIDTRIKMKLYYNNIEDKIPLKTYLYKYDYEHKLTNIYHYFENDTSKAYEYELFKYSSDNKIFNKFTYSYANDSIGWMLYDSTFYNYNGERLINEETFHFTSSSDHILHKYEYDNSNLIRKFKYHNQQLEYYTLYLNQWHRVKNRSLKNT